MTCFLSVIRHPSLHTSTQGGATALMIASLKGHSSEERSSRQGPLLTLLMRYKKQMFEVTCASYVPFACEDVDCSSLQCY